MSIDKLKASLKDYGTLLQTRAANPLETLNTALQNLVSGSPEDIAASLMPVSSIGKVIKSGLLYRGTPANASESTVGNAFFYSPDKRVAQSYAGKEGKVIETQLEFSNLLEARNWVEAKDKLGLTKADSMETLVNTARNKGYDGISFNTVSGQEFIHIPKPQNK